MRRWRQRERTNCTGFCWRGAIRRSSARRSRIKKNMNTDYTATRMIGYLYRVTNPRLEDLVDEMLAILSDRDEIMRKKEMEHAQAVINDIYNNGL